MSPVNAVSHLSEPDSNSVSQNHLTYIWLEWEKKKAFLESTWQDSETPSQSLAEKDTLSEGRVSPPNKDNTLKCGVYLQPSHMTGLIHIPASGPVVQRI